MVQAIENSIQKTSFYASTINTQFSKQCACHIYVSQQHATWHSVSIGDVNFSPQHMCLSSAHPSNISLPTTCLHNGLAVTSLLSPLELCDMLKPNSMHPRSTLVHLLKTITKVQHHLRVCKQDHYYKLYCWLGPFHNGNIHL